MIAARSAAQALAAVGLVAATTTVVAAAAGVRVNWTTSIPRGLYRVVRAPLAPGRIALACVPGHVAALGRARGYFVAGECPGGVAPVGKPVAALAGDTVEVGPAGVRVNGRLLPNTRPLARDAGGRSMPPVAPWRGVVGPDAVWLVSSANPRSYDSRYWGPVPRAAVRAVVAPLWTAE